MLLVHGEVNITASSYTAKFLIFTYNDYNHKCYLIFI